MPTARSSKQNKAWGVTKDGWFSFKMGGMEHFTTAKGQVVLSEKFRSEPLPDYLSAEKVKQLYQLPVEFSIISAQPAAASAEIKIGLKKAGSNARAIVYYGETDYLTYAPRKRNGTEKKNSVLAGDRFWPSLKEAGPVKNGTTSVKITGLKPGTKYYYRVLVLNDEGKVWNFETHSFTTKEIVCKTCE